MKLSTKFSLFNALSRVAILLLLVGVLPLVMSRLALLSTDQRLAQKKEKVLRLIRRTGITAFIEGGQSSYGSYNLLKEEFISLETIVPGPKIDVIEDSKRAVEDEVVQYRVLSYSFAQNGQNYLLEIGRSTDSIGETERNFRRYAFYILLVAVVLTGTDLYRDIQSDDAARQSLALAQRLGIARSEGARLIEEYFVQYPGVKRYMENTVEDAKLCGYVETITGRRRYLRDINSSNVNVRKAAERTAINMPIQGTSADMIKIAMVRIAEALRAGGYAARMLLQVHDELVFEVPDAESEAMRGLIPGLMQEALPLAVPVVVELGQGADWFTAHA